MENQTEPSLQLPAQLSTYAPEVDWLYDGIYATSIVFFVGIVGAMVAFMVMYRRKPGVKAEPTGHHNVLELFWTFSPLLLLFVMFHYGFTTWMDMATAPDDAINIRVRGRQWAWEFEHPNGMVEDNQLHVPVGRPVRLVMSSSDVLHSFYVPDFRVKRDLVPGMFSSLWFQAVERDPGTAVSDEPLDPERVLYTSQVYCAEYCGANGNWGTHSGHATMYSLIHVQRQADYDEFMARGPVLPCPNDAPTCTPEESGSILFVSKTCTSCHGIAEGAAAVAAPNLWNIYDHEQPLSDGTSITVDEAYLRRSILEPRSQIVQGYSPVMPNIRLSDSELTAVVAYIRSLH